jgi:hypothetical protein
MSQATHALVIIVAGKENRFPARIKWEVMKNKILTICPTIKRPAQCRDMFESFYKTRKCSDIVFNFNEGMTITDVFNLYSGSLKYEYYHMTNDDFVYHTDGWDKIFMDKLEENDGWGVCYGNDLLSTPSLCTAPFVSKKIVEATGWLQLPMLQHLCGDMVWYYIGKKLNRLFYFKDVIIEHQHFMNLKASKDDVYIKTNSRDMYQKDNETFRAWVRDEGQNVVDKIKGVMCGS